ncbi:MAG: 3'-5' exonuclease [Bacteroidales bacterium]|nr:3'-5' exonuclease [Bacteroidales bacterium]
MTNTDFKLNLTRPLCVFDLETTGLTIGRDRIVEIAVIKVMPDGSENRLHLYIDPEMEIPQESSDIHGLTNAKLKELGAKPLAECAAEITAFIGNSDLAGFNSNKFDIPFLVEELKRAGSDFDMENRYTIDVQNIFHKMEARTLAAAYKFYVDPNGFENQHTAMCDTAATLEVLRAQIVHYADTEYTDKTGKVSKPITNNVAELAAFSTVRKTADLAGRIGYDEQGREIFNFGQHKGKALRDFFRTPTGRSYLDWVLNADFPQNTKDVMLKIFNEENEKQIELKPVQKLQKPKTQAEKLDALKKKFSPGLFD